MTNPDSAGSEESASGRATHQSGPAAGPRVDLLVQGWTLNTSEGRLGSAALR